MKLLLPEVQESPEVLAEMLTVLEDLATSNNLSEALYYKAVVTIVGRHAASGRTKLALSIVRERIPLEYTIGEMIRHMLDDRDFHNVVIALSADFVRAGVARSPLVELRPTQRLAKA